jgi:cytoskeletal protein CcmA (bactofilin family)
MKTHVIGERTRVEGELSADGNLRIAGTVTGRVRVEESVVIEPSARVSGEITAASVIVRGHFEGRISASGRIALEAGSTTQAELDCVRIAIAEGAHFRGAIFTADESATMRLASPAPQHAPAPAHAQPAPVGAPAPFATATPAAHLEPQPDTTARVAAPDAETVKVPAPILDVPHPIRGERRYTHEVPTVLRTGTADHAAVDDADELRTSVVMPGAVETSDDDVEEATSTTTTDKSPAQVALLDDDLPMPGPKKGRRR